MKVFALTLVILGVLAFVRIDAAPYRKSLRNNMPKVQNDQINNMMNQQPLGKKPQISNQEPQQLPAADQNPNPRDRKLDMNNNMIHNNNNFAAPTLRAVDNGLGADARGGGLGAPGGLGVNNGAGMMPRRLGAPDGLAAYAEDTAVRPAGGGAGRSLTPAQQANLQVVGGIQQLGAQVQKPASDGAKPDNVVMAQHLGGGDGGMMPAGGAPGGAGAGGELHAPPMLNMVKETNQQLPQQDVGDGQGNNAPKLVKVPQHREQQIEQPHVENEDDKHPIKKAMFLDNHQLLKVNDLKPPNHLDAVRLEQDGHLNRDYKKEIFIGNHEEVEQGTEKQVKHKLKDIFLKIDTNSDDYISTAELETWIITKVDEHFDEAIKENEHVFKALDTDMDGDITWREFHIQFLMAKGHDQKKAEQHMEDYEAIPLDPEDKEQLIRFKFRWAEADEDPQDNKLTLFEFRNFRHPEQSENMLMRMVMDIIENLDKDQDNILTEEEFAALPPGEVDEQWKQSDRMWQDERKKEFREVMDFNKDGKVTKDELKRYVDPKNPQHSKLESQNLVELADTNKDGKVSLEEMLENTELFLGSKVVNTGRSFHDEF